MITCALCTQHHLDDNGHCTSQCLHRQPDTGLVCGVCAQRVRDDLDDIAAAWHADGAVATSSIGRTNNRPLPGGTEWIDWRQGADLRDCLGGWARVWHEDMAADDATPPSWPGADPGRLVAWLRHHFDTFGVTHEAIAEAAREWNQLAQRARRLLGDTPQGHIALCPGLDTGCGRSLRVDMARPDDLIYCRGCGTEWTAGRLLVHAGDGWVDAAAITEVMRISGSTLRRWATTGKVRRRGMTYSVADVRAHAETRTLA